MWSLVRLYLGILYGRGPLPLGLKPDDLRWNWCNNNRNKVHNRCNVLQSSRNYPTSPPWPLKTLSSTKLVPDAEKVGDCCSLGEGKGVSVPKTDFSDTSFSMESKSPRVRPRNWFFKISQFLIPGVCSIVSVTLCNPTDYSPPGSSVHNKNMKWVVIPSLQGIFPTHGSNLCLLQLLHCRQTLHTHT